MTTKKIEQHDLDKIKKEKFAALRRVLASIDKKTGKKNSAYILHDKPFEKVEGFSTGILGLDIILGGRMPLGRLIECLGQPSGGKSLIAQKIIGSAQKQGLTCAFLDIEGTFDEKWAQGLGVNTDELILSPCETAEQAFVVLSELIQSGLVNVIVLDSIAALVTEQEFDNDPGKQTIALLARFLSQELKKINVLCTKYNCTVIMINQIRDNVGVLYAGMSTISPGGKALKFYSSVRIEVNKVGSSDIKEKIGTETVSVGHMVRAKLVKSKISPPGRSCQFPIYFDGRTVDIADELAEVIISQGLIPKYNAKNEIDPLGKTYRFTVEDEILEVKKKDDIKEALRRLPKIKQYFVDLIKSGEYIKEQNQQIITDDELTDEEFERQAKQDAEDIKNGTYNEGAEEIEESDDWNEI